MNKINIITSLLLLFLLKANSGEIITIKPKNTISVVEMNSGDILNYTLQSGRLVKVKLLETKVQIVFTNLEDLKEGHEGGGTIYSMICKLNIDGQEMELVRYVSVQQSFYEPYTVNGLNVWFDCLSSLADYFNENHGDCLPTKEARFCFHDATLPICPEQLVNWVAIPDKKLFAKNAYRGDDTWLGLYFGADLHGGLDINMPSNTTLYAPMDFNEQYFFSTQTFGHKNHRWRGVRNWDNGDSWALQTHHIVELIVKEGTALKKGTPYAYTAGRHAGYIPHTHFVFKVKQANMNECYMDPWIIFWQIFENNKDKEKSIKANFLALEPTETGNPVSFKSEGSRQGLWGNVLEYYWDFGDGHSSIVSNPTHVYSHPGIYPVTLIVKDGHSEDVYRQFIIVNGAEKASDYFSFSCINEPSFNLPKTWKTLEYAKSEAVTNTVYFKNYQWSKDTFDYKEVVITPHKDWNKDNIDDYRIEAKYKHGNDWLKLRTEYFDDKIKLLIKPEIWKMFRLWGFYEANIIVHFNNIENSPQMIKVFVDFEHTQPESIAIIDNKDEECTYSSYFWLTPEYIYDWSKGYNGNFLINKDNSQGEYVRFTPNLIDGTYKIQLHGRAYENKMLLAKTEGFYAKIIHNNKTDKVWVEPSRSLEIGTFDFAKGREGFVEIISENSKGLILLDAIKFERVEN